MKMPMAMSVAVRLSRAIQSCGESVSTPIRPIIDIALPRFRVHAARNREQNAGGAAKRTVNRPHRQFMQTVLEKILENKRQEVAERKKSAPFEQLQDKIAELGRP